MVHVLTQHTVLMNSIIDNQRDILLSVEGSSKLPGVFFRDTDYFLGTNIWSGQQPQQYNSQAIAWGGLSHELFAVGKRYQWVYNPCYNVESEINGFT